MLGETIFFEQQESIKLIEEMRQAMFDQIAEHTQLLKQMNPKQMKKVIRVPELVEKNDKPVEFTHELTASGGWGESKCTPCDFDAVVYLGSCDFDGDMFAAYDNGCIDIFKGDLNSGEY